VLERVLLFGLYAMPLTVSWTVAGVHIAAGLAAAAALALGLVCGRWPVRRTVADRALVAFAIACVLATLGSAERLESAVALKKLLLLPLLHLAAGGLATPFRSRTALRLFVGAMAATACIALLHFALVPHAADARLRSTGHYMTFAGLLLLAWPSCAAAAMTTRGRTRAVYTALLPVFALALLLGFTRGAWLGSVAAGVAMLVRARSRAVWFLPVAAVLLVAVLPSGYRQRALSSFDAAHPTNIDRVRMWRAGLAMWRDHPWTGVGQVDVRPYYLRYRSTTEGRIHGHLHDNWIHIAATTGTLGLLAFLWLMVGFGRIAWAAGRAGPDPERRGLALGVWGAFWGFQVMGLFEWNFGDVEVTIALCSLLGAGLAAAVAGESGAPAGVAARGLST
jgi:O-antigen ligase